MISKDELIKKVKEESKLTGDKIISIRRQIHKNPEVSGNEVKTSALVKAVLEEAGYDVKANVAGHGVVGLLRGPMGKVDTGRTIAIRADMDALRLEDKKDCDYASTVDGVMHGCGHDVHTACGLGAALVLSKLKEHLKGDVKFIFQPSEESPEGGASFMIDEGVLEDPKVDAIIALHCFPELEVGVAGHRPGPMTASFDMFTIKVKGKSGHASRPHQSVDAIHVSAMVINALHHIVSRRMDPMHPAVITVGTIEGGTAENVIADEVTMRGNIRALDENIRRYIPMHLEEMLSGITSSMGASFEFHFEEGCPSVVNDKEIDSFMADCQRDLFGEESVRYLEQPSMGGEDFAFFTERVPGALIRLGTRNVEKGVVKFLHNSRFDVDEDCLYNGVSLLSYGALSFLLK